MPLCRIKLMKAPNLFTPFSNILRFLERCTKHTKVSHEKINKAQPFRLLGPPKLHYFPPPSTAPVEESDDDDCIKRPIMGLTENNSPTFLSSGNPCLDFFFHVVPDTQPPELIQRLESAWSHNALTTLKLVCNLRGVRGTGKSDTEGFYTAAIWLHQCHPKTLAGNVKVFADFGYFKDLLEILYRTLEGPLIRKIEKEDRQSKSVEREMSFGRGYGWRQKKGNEEKSRIKQRRTLGKQKWINKARKALDRYYLDDKYRFLHDRISDLFVELLKDDLEKLSSGDRGKISLASKWCPSIDSSYDKATLMCESIARKMFPKENHSEHEGIKEAHYVYSVRERLRGEVLVPLHKALELPEVFMSAHQWNMLPYNRVASVAMRNYKESFMKHDGERFKEYLDKVKSGHAKIAAGALLPHQIIRELDNEETGEVAELQWKRMVSDLSAKGKLKNSLAICDVSDSMEGTPMEVSVALGVLVSELSEEPWKGKLITFSANPQLQEVKGDTLKAKTNFVRGMEWGMNTDFQRAFDRILDIAVKENLSEEQMIKRLFVFSDMEFDEASQKPWETDYQAIQRKFKKKGYQNVPEIVFWNLRDSQSTPVLAKQSGVALVSGFSKNILTVFLDSGGIINPEQVMELAISGKEYKKLVVFD